MWLTVDELQFRQTEQFYLINVIPENKKSISNWKETSNIILCRNRPHYFILEIITTGSAQSSEV